MKNKQKDIIEREMSIHYPNIRSTANMNKQKDKIIEETKWILQRGTDIIGTFEKRNLAIEHLLMMLKQSVEDLEGQNKLDSEYDYNIDFKQIQIYKIKIRPAYLGL